MARTIQLHPKGAPSFKYNINQQIGLLPHKKDLIQQIIAHLKESGISRNEFYTDRAIPFGSSKSISADRLLIYAQVFECTTDELVNSQVTVKSIREAMAPSRKLKTKLK